MGDVAAVGVVGVVVVVAGATQQKAVRGKTERSL
jgi:hypothetical protein